MGGGGGLGGGENWPATETTWEVATASHTHAVTAPAPAKPTLPENLRPERTPREVRIAGVSATAAPRGVIFECDVSIILN